MSKYYIDQENVFYLEYVLPITTQWFNFTQNVSLYNIASEAY